VYPTTTIEYSGTLDCVSFAKSMVGQVCGTYKEKDQSAGKVPTSELHEKRSHRTVEIDSTGVALLTHSDNLCLYLYSYGNSWPLNRCSSSRNSIRSRSHWWK
jgi:hypothetical protein